MDGETQYRRISRHGRCCSFTVKKKNDTACVEPQTRGGGGGYQQARTSARSALPRKANDSVQRLAQTEKFVEKFMHAGPPGCEILVMFVDPHQSRLTITASHPALNFLSTTSSCLFSFSVFHLCHSRVPTRTQCSPTLKAGVSLHSSTHPVSLLITVDLDRRSRGCTNTRRTHCHKYVPGHC